MAILEDILGESIVGSTGGALAIGMGILVLAPRLLPAAGRAARPLAKEMIKLGLRSYDAVRETAEESTAAVREIVAENRVGASPAAATVAAPGPKRRERRKKVRKTTA